MEFRTPTRLPLGPVASHVFAVAVNTYRETVRDRIFYLVGAFGFVLVASSVVISPLTIGAQDKIVSDVGLGAMSLFGLLVAILVGSNMVRKEIDRRTITTILAKPLARRTYLLGKFCGLNLTLLCMMGIMGALFFLVLLLTPGGVTARYLPAIYLAFLELMLVNAAVSLFSALMSPALAAVLALGFYAMGHMSESLRSFGQAVGSEAYARVGEIVYHVLPNLEMFNVRGAVVHGDTVSGEHLLIATVYGLAYTALLLVAAGAVFARKELR
ncbi:MAG: ABC transporter permease subunit [Candidatus Krumholzibacteriia bacterium]